ncbi:MAG: FHA domain-containing protein [Actinomycetia bacterium]|nr:FHA domain-containing protein [Actinomycetes bacterium]
MPQVTDNSQEAHLVDNQPAIFHFAGRSPVERFFISLFFDFWWLLLIIAILIILLVVFRVVRKHKGIVKVDGKIGFGDAVEFKQHFSTPESDQICLIVTDARGKSTKVALDIHKSVFVGRSQENNLSFDDDRLSRQHFAIELQGQPLVRGDQRRCSSEGKAVVDARCRFHVLGGGQEAAGQGEDSL